MYRFFTLDYKNFKTLNEGGNDYRSIIAQPIELLTNQQAFKMHKIKKDKLYRETVNLVYHISNAVSEYPRFEIFGDDLAYMGYEGHEYKEFPDERIEDQIKLVDLLLGFSYTY